MPSPRPKTDLALIPDDDWNVANARLDAVRRLLAAEVITTELIDAEAEKLGVARAWMYRLLNRYRDNPTVHTLLPKPMGNPRGRQRLPSETETIVEQAIDDFYLTAQCPTVKRLHLEIARRCNAAGVARVPSFNTVRARVRSVKASRKVRARHGKKAADDRFRPVRASYHADYALEVIQVDHSLADAIIVDELYRLPIQRPWLTLAIDVASSAVAGLYLTLEAPSALSVALALTHTVLPKDDWLRGHGITAPWPVHGLPKTIHVDNGKEFHSRALERGCRAHDIDLKFRPRRTPHYGGHIERLIGTFMGEVHLLPGTTFSNVQEKGSYDSEKTAVMTLREFDQWLASQVIAYNSHRHRIHQRPPRMVYAEALARRPEPITVPADARRFYLDFLPFELRMVRRDGIHLFNIRYFDNVLSAFAGLSKEKMIVKYDPRDLSRVFLQDPEGNYWDIPYADLQRPRITLWEHRQAMQRLRAEGRSAVDEQTIFDAISAQLEIVAEAARRTKAARRSMQRGAEARRTGPPTAAVPDEAQPDPEPSVPPRSGPPVLPFEVEEWS